MSKRLQQVIDYINLEDYVRQNISDVLDAAGGNELRVNCFSPHGCNGSDTGHKLYINPVKKRWNCFKCGYGDSQYQPKSTNIIQFMADVENKPPGIIYYNLMQMSIPAPSDDFEDRVKRALLPKDRTQKESDLQTTLKPLSLPSYYYPLMSLTGTTCIPYKKYLIRRGLNTEDVVNFNIRLCGRDLTPGDKAMVNRLVFPIYDTQGNIVSCQGRSMAKKTSITKGGVVRWLTWPGRPVEGCLWPLVYTTNGGCPQPTHVKDLGWLQDHSIVLVEGIFDVIGSLKAGIHAMATFGKRLSNSQIHLLQELGIRRIVLAWDYNAKHAMKKVAKRLNDAGTFDVYLIDFSDTDYWSQNDIGDLAVNPDKHTMYQDAVRDSVSWQSPNLVKWLMQ